MTGDTVADRHVHPATVPLRALKDAPSILLGLPAAYAFASEAGIGGMVSGVAVVGLVLIVYQWLSWRRFRYGIGADEIVIESGILSRTRRSIPIDRIQDVDIEQGPLARLFGLAKLRIETGGSGGDEGILDSVSVAEAERLRGAIRTARAAPTANAETVERDTNLLFVMGPGRLLAAGLFNFSMVYIAGIFALLQTFDRVLPFDIYDPGRWMGLVGSRLQGRLSAGALAAVALVALVLGVVTGLARTFARDFGFRLTLEPEGMRRRRGLFTRSDVLIPRARTQVALIETGPLRRSLGWFVLSFQTLGAEGAVQGGNLQSAAPLARAEEIDLVLEAAADLRRADPASLSRVSSRRISRRLLLAAPFPLIAGAVAAFVWPPALLGVPPLLLYLVAIVVERRFHRYGLEDGLLFVQAGLWRQRQRVIATGKIQSLRLSRSWLQRRLDLATLSIDTAGAPMLGGAEISDLRIGDAQELAGRLLRPA
jgi:putative membrane protein